MIEEPVYLVNDQYVLRVGHYESRPIWGALLISVRMSGGQMSAKQFAALCERRGRFRGRDAVMWGSALASMLETHPSAKYVSVEGLTDAPPSGAICGKRPGHLLREDTPGETGLGPDTMYSADVETVLDVALFLQDSDLGFEVW